MTFRRLTDRPRVYLAGNITQNLDGEWGAGWRDFFKSNYADFIDSVDPLDSECPENDEYTSNYYAKLIATDFDLIMSSDVFLYYYQDGVPQVGSSMEQLFAYDMDIPIVVVYDGDPADASPFLWGHADALVTNLEHAAEAAVTLYGRLERVRVLS